MKKKNKKKLINFIIFLLLIIFISFMFCWIIENLDISIALSENENIPSYANQEFIYIDDNKPNFADSDYTLESFERYSDLDWLGRVGVAFANIGKDLMPTEERKPLTYRPTGWIQEKYEVIRGKYLYNRCHLIGFQLTAENNNERNLMTCTKQMNVNAMLEFENEVADYVKNDNGHVLYRVTPVFEGNNLLASGVQMEASSVEDHCGKICFNVYIYNVQDEIEINYADGSSKLKD